MSKRIILLILSCFVLMGCATFKEEFNKSMQKSQRKREYKIVEYKDKFEGYTLIRMESNKIKSSFNIEMNLIKYISKDNKIEYTLFVIYSNKDWIFIQKGNSLILLIDGEIIEFYSVLGSLNNRNLSDFGYITETATYKITPKQIKKILEAENVELKIKGSEGYVMGKFNAMNFRNFKRFYNDFCEK